VIAPARTGKDRRSKIAVIITDHTKSGMESRLLVEDRMFKMVVMKLIAPRMEEAPAKCRLKIAKSTEIPEWNKLLANGG